MRSHASSLLVVLTVSACGPSESVPIEALLDGGVAMADAGSPDAASEPHPDAAPTPDGAPAPDAEADAERDPDAAPDAAPEPARCEPVERSAEVLEGWLDHPKAQVVDLNGDGHLDIVRVAWLGFIDILWGDGAGAFTYSPGLTIMESEGAADLAVGDVDGDGRLDLVVAYLTGRKVQAWLARGEWYEAGPVTELDGQLFTIDGGDVDGDGHFDVMLANFSRHGATVLFGGPDGALDDALFMPTGIEPHGGVLADVDRDGHLDVVMANAGTHDAGNDFVTINYGRGGRAFGEAVELEVGNGPFTVAVGDLNRDGHRDIVAGNFGTPISGARYRGGDTLSVLLGEGERRFAPQVEYPAGDGPNHVRLADVNGDGHLDALSADRGNFDFARREPVGGGTVTISLGDGEGGLCEALALDSGRSLTGVAVGDLDEDGALDIVSVGSGRTTLFHGR